ncbi:GIY-YIG nuclease family protein [Streptomyces althioticus]|uniref:GIY-YIG nuclease family protein n=1 Tax=Streptomyces althioticus TaxID=83380 RepID=UPI00379A36AE
MTTRTLSRGQRVVLIAATVPMIGFGALGGWGTFTNVVSAFGPDRRPTALGVVAAGEGSTLVLALVMVLLTMFGQPSPWPVRAGLWAAPAAAAVTGIVVAGTLTERVVYGVTPMAMCVAAEGLGLVARRYVVYRTREDVETQRRNAAIMRRIAYHRARAERHPWKWVRKWSALAAWRLMRRAGEGDVELGVDLIRVQRVTLTEGAGQALGDMLAVGPTPAAPGTARALPPAPSQTAKPIPKQQPPSRPAGPIGEPLEDFTSLLGKPHAPVVYFIRNGNRLKIGVTQNLARRVSAISLRVSDVVRVEHGHAAYENVLHDRFRALRVGDTEWFELRGDLADYLSLPDGQAHGITASEPEDGNPNEPEPEHEKSPLPGEPMTKVPVLVVKERESTAAGANRAQDHSEPACEEAEEPAPALVGGTEMRQIIELATRLREGEPLTKKTAAPLLGVSPATAQRRLTQAHRVVKLAERLKAGERLTPATAAPLLGVDEDIAERRLIEARKLNGEGQGFYA